MWRACSRRALKSTTPAPDSLRGRMLDPVGDQSDDWQLHADVATKVRRAADIATRVAAAVDQQCLADRRGAQFGGDVLRFPRPANAARPLVSHPHSSHDLERGVGDHRAEFLPHTVSAIRRPAIHYTTPVLADQDRQDPDRQWLAIRRSLHGEEQEAQRSAFRRQSARRHGHRTAPSATAPSMGQ